MTPKTRSGRLRLKGITLFHMAIPLENMKTSYTQKNKKPEGHQGCQNMFYITSLGCQCDNYFFAGHGLNVLSLSPENWHQTTCGSLGYPSTQHDNHHLSTFYIDF